MSRLVRRRNSESGAAAVEFALILPVLLLLVFGIIEFGFIFNRWVTVTHAAREGVRVFALTGVLDDGIEAAQTSAPDIVSEIECTGTGPTALPDSSGSEVTMTCNTNYDLSLFVFTDTITFGSTAKMRKE